MASRLGQGGQGVVYEAYDAEGVRVAVKLLHPGAGPEALRMFRREGRAARRVAAFCTARVLEVSGDDENATAGARGDGPAGDGGAFLVSEYVPGPSLADHVREHGALEADALVRLAIGVATALSAIHHASVIHRDLKPANVLLGPDGPRIIDFGIARAPDMSLTAPGVIMGTFGFMAPEILAGQRATRASDVFSWGATLLYASGGGIPYRGETVMEAAYRAVSVEPDLGTVPAAIRPVVARALSRDPARRPAAAELLDVLLGAPVSWDPAREGRGRGPDHTAAGPAGSGAGPADPRLLLLREGARRARALVVPTAVAAEAPLGERAELAYLGLSPEQRRVAHEVMLRLVVPGDRVDGSEDGVRTASGRELRDGRAEGGRGDVAVVVDRLVAVGLLVRVGDEGGVRPGGSAALTAWPRLREWVAADRSGLALRARIVEATRTWEEHGRRREDLPRGTLLLRAAAWAAVAPGHLRLVPAERECLERARESAGRAARRRRYLTAGLSAALVSALLAGGVAWYQKEEVDRRRAEQRARSAAQTAQTLRASDPRAAMLVGLAAWRTAEIPESRAALTAAATQREIAVTALPAFRFAPGSERVLTESGAAVVTNTDRGGLRRVPLLDPAQRPSAVAAAKETHLAFDVNLSRSGAFVVTVDSQSRRVTVRSVRSGAVLGRPFDLNGRSVSGVTDKGDLLLSSGNDRSPTLVSPAGETLATLPPSVVRVSPDGRHAVSCLSPVRLWDITPQGEAVRERELFASAPQDASDQNSCDRAAQFTSDSATVLKHVSTGQGEETVVLTPVGPDGPGRTVTLTGLPAGLRPSSGGRFMVGTGVTGDVEVWSAAGGTGPLLRLPLPGRPTAGRSLVKVALAEDTGTLLVLDGDTVRHLDLTEVLGGAGVDDSTAARAVSADGRFALRSVRVPGRGEGAPHEYTSRIVDLRTGRQVGASIPVDLRAYESLPAPALGGLDDIGRFAAYATWDSRDRYGVGLWDVRAARAVGFWPARQNWLPAWFRFSPDGRHLAVADVAAGVPDSDSGMLRVYDLRAEKEVRVWENTSARGAFSPDGSRFLTTDGKSLDLATGALRDTGLGEGVSELLFSPNGRTLAVRRATGIVELWDGAVTRRTAALSGTADDEDPRRSSGPGLLFSPDGRLLASPTGTDSVQLWDPVAALALGAPIPRSGRAIEAMGFDGTILRTLNGNGAYAVDLAPDSLAARVCARAGRDLTREEWAAYVPDTPYRRLC
ncbi:protein kinase domain-containing protein (plasmid) [Streptomyces sp. BI20]|uniref:protein kinase domain-containing protein n=1 Tax=Streptomyces sp. BI20 TaxID=3403460 RepID=UPI003C765164